MLIYSEQNVPDVVRIIQYRGVSGRAYCPSELDLTYPAEELLHLGSQLHAYGGRPLNNAVVYVNVTRRFNDPRKVSVLVTPEYVIPQWLAFAGNTALEVPNEKQDFALQNESLKRLR